MFSSIFDSSATGMEITNVLIVALVGAILGVVIALAHKMTSRTTKDFLVTIATLPILVTVVMMMINGSLGTSIAILGAFSLVRFRSMPGSAKELLSVFFSMAIGLALGMGHVLFASVFTAIVAGLEIFYDKVTLFSNNRGEQVLKIVIPEDMDYTKVFQEEFKKYTVKHELMKSKTINMGSLYKVTYLVQLKNRAKEKEFIDAIRVKNCNLQVLLSTSEANEEL